jgi:hypothetical protein
LNAAKIKLFVRFVKKTIIKVNDNFYINFNLLLKLYKGHEIKHIGLISNHLNYIVNNFESKED